MRRRVPVTKGVSRECLGRSIPTHITDEYNPDIMRLTDDQFRQYQREGDVVTDGLESSVKVERVTSHIREPMEPVGVLFQQFLVPYATGDRSPRCV
ncbi:MAG: hypothetical protein ACI80F_002804 [Natronomonas sp.]|jgi:hypothetical protein